MITSPKIFLLMLVSATPAWFSGFDQSTVIQSRFLTRPTSELQDPEPWVSLVDATRIKHWKFIDFGGREAFEVKSGELTVEAGYPLAGFVYSGEFPKDHYELELEAQKVSGTDFFCLVTFPVKDEFCSFVVGGWGGTVSGISCVDQVDASENETKTVKKFEYDRWYKIRIQVTPKRLRCWIDNAPAVDLPLEGVKLSLRTDVDNTKPLSICSFETISRWKNIRLKSLK